MFLRSAFLSLSLLACAAASFTASAAGMAFGGKTLEVPAPPEFVPVQDTLPQYFEVIGAYLPPSMRLAEAYLLPADVQAMSQDEGNGWLERYFQLQVLRQVEGVPVSKPEFAPAMAQLEKVMADKARMDSEAAKYAAQGNAALEGKTDKDVSLAIGDSHWDGVFRREDWGLFHHGTMRVAVEVDGKMTDARVAYAQGMVLVDGQILSLNAYADTAKPGAEAWVQSAVSDWADAISKANP